MALFSTPILCDIRIVAKGKRPYRKLGGALLDERLKANITQVVLAEKLRCAPSRIVRIEKGEQRIDVVEFLSLAKAVGFDPANFIQTLRADC